MTIFRVRERREHLVEAESPAEAIRVAREKGGRGNGTIEVEELTGDELERVKAEWKKS